MCVQQALFNCNNILLPYIPLEKRLDVTLCLPVQNRVQNRLWNSSVHQLHSGDSAGVRVVCTGVGTTAGAVDCISTERSSEHVELSQRKPLVGYAEATQFRRRATRPDCLRSGKAVPELGSSPSRPPATPPITSFYIFML
eukprot:COSAG01_NODE_2086_length_8456_cov_9.203662_5_plen_140_part_00